MSKTKEKQAPSLPIETYQYMLQWAEKKYQMETEREESLIQQAATMQNGFAFMTAAVFVVATLVVEHCQKVLSPKWIILIFGSITLVLLASLFCATMAQNRLKYTTFPDVKDMNKHIMDYYDKFEDEKARCQYDVDRYAEYQLAKAKNNDRRVKWIRLSMRLFYLSLILCVVWFGVAMWKYLI